MFFIIFAALLYLWVATSHRGDSGRTEKQQKSADNGNDTAKLNIRQSLNK